MNNRAIDLQLIKPVKPGSSGSKGKIFLKQLLKEELKELNVPTYDSCCGEVPPDPIEPFNLVTQDTSTINFSGSGTVEDPLTAEAIGDAEASTLTQSKYLLEKISNNFYLDGPKIRDINNKSLVSLYKMPAGNFTNNIDTMTKSGAMSSATISLDDGFDNVIVAGSDQNSYIQFPFILTQTRCIYKLRVRVDAVGATPLIGFRNIWPGSTYSNFNNPQFYGYFNLLTGVVTTTTGGTTTVMDYNGWQGAVGVGDIIELEIKYEYMRPRIFSITKVSDVLTGEISTRRQLKSQFADGDWSQITHPAIIMADGTYTVLDYEVFSLDSEPFFLIDGDSMGCGVRTTYEDSIVGKLNTKLPYKTASIAAGTKRTLGHLSTLWEVIKLRPTYIIIFNYIDSLYPNQADPANGNHATWSVDFQRYINTIKALGITPIFIYPETWTFLANATQCGYYETYLNTTFPSDLKVKVLTSESFYDGTGFHYAGATNEIIANKIITLLDTVL